MNIIVAKTAGFCFGVDRAIKIVEEQGKNGGVYTLGPVIHNKQEVDRLASLGAKVINEPDDAQEGDKVVIRSHGVSSIVENLLIQRGIKVIDATCPYVKKIHSIVNQHYNNGYQILIVGDKNHPEVIGINGRCENTGIIISKSEDLNNINVESLKLCVVAQTTQSRENWENIIKIIKNTCKDVVFFDTICSATNERQKEAEILASKCDCVLVVGGKNSSNTTKLLNICSLKCNRVYHIEGAWELPSISPYLYGTIGIIAGASTPDWIIKEVVNTMEENVQKGELSFAEEFEKSLITLNTGDVVKGTVIRITPTEVYVDLGYKADGVISADELTDNPDLKPEDIVKVGEEIEVFIIRVSDVEGTVGLSVKKLESIKGWKILNEAFENKTDLKGKVIEVVNSGIIVFSNGARIFVPASQANDRYLSDLSVLLGKEVPVRIIDINKSRKKIVGSIKAVLAEQKETKSVEFWAKIESGQKEFKGVVKTLTNFGAFVDLGGVDGLVHISELSWDHIKHPSEVLKEGDVIDVTILEANKETGKISLGYKKANENPWEIAKAKFNVGDVITVKVVRLVPFGAFVEMIPGIDGLIHISQIANKRIGKPSDELSIGQEVEAKITDINWETRKIALSIRELLPVEETEVEAGQEEAAKESETAGHTEEMDMTMADSMKDIEINE